MDIYEALYTTRMMRRLRPDPIPLDTQARILDAAVRAPNGGNTQRWHFLAVDDPKLIRQFAESVPTGPRTRIREVPDGEGTDGGHGARRGPGRSRRNDAPNERLRGLPGGPFRRDSAVAFRLRHRRPRRRQHLPGDLECVARRASRRRRRRHDDGAPQFHGRSERVTGCARGGGLDDVGHADARLPTG